MAAHLTRFDNVVFDMFAVSAVVDDLTINHSGTTATFTGVSFLAPATGHLVVAQDTQNNGVPLVVRFVNANQADGSAQTTTAGGASVTWNSTPGEANLAITDEHAGDADCRRSADLHACRRQRRSRRRGWRRRHGHASGWRHVRLGHRAGWAMRRHRRCRDVQRRRDGGRRDHRGLDPGHPAGSRRHREHRDGSDDDNGSGVVEQLADAADDDLPRRDRCRRLDLEN